MGQGVTIAGVLGNILSYICSITFFIEWSRGTENGERGRKKSSR
jgi:hypothetical protein